MKTLVLTGDGINCELEMAFAIRRAGHTAEIRHLNDLIADGVDQAVLEKNYQSVLLPGGFSFGDDLASGKVLAIKIRRALGWDFNAYAAQGGRVLGVCNGFQALIKLGVFGDDVSIVHNRSGRFIDDWVDLEFVPGVETAWWKSEGAPNRIRLPIRHGEGRVVYGFDGPKQARIFLKYVDNINGSAEQTAGLCDSTGRIVGLMPHPEAFIRWTSGPDWTAQPERANETGDGWGFFRE